MDLRAVDKSLRAGRFNGINRMHTHTDPVTVFTKPVVEGVDSAGKKLMLSSDDGEDGFARRNVYGFFTATGEKRRPVTLNSRMIFEGSGTIAGGTLLTEKLDAVSEMSTQPRELSSRNADTADFGTGADTYNERAAGDEFKSVSRGTLDRRIVE